MKITTTAALMTGLGFMPQTSTKFMPWRLPQSIIESDHFIAAQTSSSVVQLDIVEIYRIGEDNYLRIQEISNFQNGWDGYKARPIPESVINRTKALLMVLPSGAKLFPTSRGTMQIEYHKEDNYLEIEVSPRTYELYSVKGGEEFEDTVNKTEVQRRVEAFLA